MERDPKANPAAHQPGKAELEEDVSIDAAPEALAWAVTRGGAERKIATGEAQDTTYDQPNKVRAGQAGARARTVSRTPDERSAIARKAARGRWGNGIGT